jgi:nucleoside-diphosphate-sugar epimerase
LPLALVNNRRSLVYIGNLSDALIRVSEAPALESGVFLISDGEAISTPELVRRISRALGHAPRLLPAPVWMLRMAGVLTGKADTIDRLTGSLVINDDKLRHAMGWTPPFNMIQGLERTVEWFRDQT